MRKRLITPIPQDAPLRDEEWLDLDGAAVVEVTSEEKDYPVESALVPGEMRGWRAADPGTQANLRSAAKTHAHRARLRGSREKTHPRVRLAVVSGWRTLVS